MIMLDKILPYLKNFYFICGVILLLWMLFFDSNDLISQYKMSRKLKELENEVSYFEDKIHEVEAERAALLTDKDKLERFARETYRMKKPSEEVYVIEFTD